MGVYELRPHQRLQLEFLAKRKRALVTACCGIGKTITELFAITQCEAKLALLVVPWLVLSSQFINDYLEYAMLPALKNYRWLCVCSTGTTDTQQVRDFLSLPEQRLLIVTYHSLWKVADALVDADNRLDIVCFDEAHHTTETGSSDVVEKIVSMSERAYYFTATPSSDLCQKIGRENEITYSLPEELQMVFVTAGI